jgi:hypothetical protein
MELVIVVLTIYMGNMNPFIAFYVSLEKNNAAFLDGTPRSLVEVTDVTEKSFRFHLKGRIVSPLFCPEDGSSTFL